MEFKAKQIADFIGGHVEGNEDAAVFTFAKIEEGKPGAISFLSNPKYTHYLYDTESTIVLVNEDLELEHEVKPTLIRVKNAYEAVAKLLQLYASMQPKKTGIDKLASISETAKIGKDVFIGAFAVIGEGAVIGDGIQTKSDKVCEVVNSSGYRSGISTTTNHDSIGDRTGNHRIGVVNDLELVGVLGSLAE